MNQPEDNFGAEIVRLSAEFLSLAQLAEKSGGFVDKSKAQEVLSEINVLCDETKALLTAPAATQQQVDALAAHYGVVMARVFALIKTPGAMLQ